MTVIAHCIVDEQAFKEAVWAIDRNNFRPGDALDAFERAKVKGVEPSTTQGAVEAERHRNAAEAALYEAARQITAGGDETNAREGQ